MPEDQIKALLTDAAQYLVSGDFDQAIRLSRAVLVLDPNNSEAAQILRTAIAANSSLKQTTENLINEAKESLTSGQFDDAINVSRSILRLDPNNAEAAQILRTALKTVNPLESLEENPSPEEKNISNPLDSHNEPQSPNPPTRINRILKESADGNTRFEKLMEGIWKIFSIIPFPIKVLVIGSFIVSLAPIEIKETFGWVTMGIGMLMAGSALGMRGGSWNWNWNRWVMNLKWGLVLFFMGLMNFPCQVLEASP